MSKKTVRYGSYVILAAGFITVLYYILFKMQFEYSILSADNMIDAIAAAETGTIVNRGFWYEYNMPFSASLIMTLLVKVLGPCFTVVKAGMAISFLILSFAVFILLKSLGLSIEENFLCLGGIQLILLGSESLRVAVFSHTSYYTISVILTLIIHFFYIRKESRIFKILMFFTIMIASVNGYHVVTMSVLAFMISIFVKWICDRKGFKELKEEGSILLISGLAASLGLIIRRKAFGDISYEGMIGHFEAFENWFFKEKSFLTQWITLFTGNIPEETNMMTPEGLFVMIHYLTGLVILILPVIALISYKNHKDERVKLFIINYWVLFFVTIFTFSIGFEQKENWRLSGLAVMASIVSALELIYIIKGKITQAEIGVLLVSAIFIVCLINILITVKFIKTDNDKNTITSVLKEEGLYYGYASYHEYANALTVLTDSEIKVRPIELGEDGSYRIERRENQYSWYEGEPGMDEYFVILDKKEARDQKNNLVANAKRAIESEDKNVLILVFEGNIFAEGQALYYNIVE
ncbi:MAG: hypothetical protein K5931_03275 [Lachnospiraceae bacterium]|nr:hypothetical protein [Lachnospiraceae bacterium]